MKNASRRKLSTLLFTLIATLFLTISAWAASGQVNIVFADGRTTTLVNTSDILLHEIGATDVESVTIGDGVVSDTYTDFANSITRTLTGGTKYQIYVTTALDGTKALRFKYTNTLNDNISIVVTERAVTYSVQVNSGAYGQHKNQGGTATCTMSAASSSSMSGGSSYSVDFAPKSGQEITKLNLRINAADGTGKIVDAVDATVRIGGQNFTIKVSDVGKVSVTANPLVRNVYITALTRDETKKYNLNGS